MKKLRLAFVVSPAIFIFLLTLIVSYVTSHPERLFFTRSTIGIPIRFVIIVLVVVAPTLMSPRILALAGDKAREGGFFGQLVETGMSIDPEPSIPVVWALRPLQGIGLSLIFAEKFLPLLEFAIGTYYDTQLLLGLTLFVGGSALVSLFLSVVWALDDLGLRTYSKKTGEVRMVGRSVGTVLPLITGIIGVTSLFQRSLLTDALMDLLWIVMILYPPYLLFVVIHHEFIRKRGAVLIERLFLKRIETKAV